MADNHPLEHAKVLKTNEGTTLEVSQESAYKLIRLLLDQVEKSEQVIHVPLNKIGLSE